MTRALLLIDGEHYPPVVAAGVAALEGGGIEPVGAIFVGGYEKTASPPRLSIPVYVGDPIELLPSLVEEMKIDEVIDLTDEPVTDPRARFRIAGRVLASGSRYSGGGIVMEPVPLPELTAIESVSVIGTGKRTGKTAVAIEIARRWTQRGLSCCIVTMGRGGPPDPVLLEAREAADPLRLFERLRQAGLHATSDYVEDALFAGVDTVGTRRLGAGPAGAVVGGNFGEGVQLAGGLGVDRLIFEGSGTAIPPAASRATVLVTRSDIDREFLTGYLGPYRLWLSDILVVVRVAGAPSEPISRDVKAVNPHIEVVEVTIHPEPSVSVVGKRALVVTTANARLAPEITKTLLERGAASVRVVHTLSDRLRLASDLGDMATVDVVLTEVKAAAADIVAPAAAAAEVEFGFIHNSVRGDLDRLVGLLDP